MLLTGASGKSLNGSGERSDASLAAYKRPFTPATPPFRVTTFLADAPLTRWCLLMLLCSLVLGGAGALVSAVAEAAPEQRYRAEAIVAFDRYFNLQQEIPDLVTYENWVREAYIAAQRRDRLGLEEVAPRIVAAREVRLPDGSLLQANMGWLAQALSEPDADLELIETRLGIILDALAWPNPQVDPQAIAALRELLSKPPFAPPEQQSLTWLDQLAQALQRLFDWLFPNNGGIVSQTSDLVGWGLILLGTISVIALLVYTLLSLRRSIVNEAQAHKQDPEAGLTASTALQQATEIARSGDYRTAVRYLYLSSLLWLDERNLLRYDRALTNREYLVQVRHNQNLYGSLLPIVETFDQVWYGHMPIDSSTFEKYRQQIDALRRVVSNM